jgi:hypothetical protein
MGMKQQHIGMQCVLNIVIDALGWGEKERKINKNTPVK